MHVADSDSIKIELLTFYDGDPTHFHGETATRGERSLQEEEEEEREMKSKTSGLVSHEGTTRTHSVV